VRKLARLVHFPGFLRSALTGSLSIASRTVAPARWGNLRRLTPFSTQFGFDRGLPIDRYYIESFLRAQASHIHGAVLEIGDDTYTRMFGGPGVTSSTVLHAATGNPKADIVADLSDPRTAEKIGLNSLHCIIFTQTLQFIPAPPAALDTLYKVLKTGGHVLATFPGISQISRYDMERWGDLWRFTDASAKRLFGEVFGPDSTTVRIFGNVLTATALLYGLSANELSRDELEYLDQDYQVILAVAATKVE
jgi:hypothetical protein